MKHLCCLICISFSHIFIRCPECTNPIYSIHSISSGKRISYEKQMAGWNCISCNRGIRNKICDPHIAILFFRQFHQSDPDGFGCFLLVNYIFSLTRHCPDFLPELLFVIYKNPNKCIFLWCNALCRHFHGNNACCCYKCNPRCRPAKV